MCDLVFGDAVGDLRVETGLWAYDGDFRFGIETVQDPTCCNL